MASELTIAVPTDAREVAALQREAESDCSAITRLEVATDDEYAFADQLLTHVVQRRDAAIAMRRQATVPLYAVIKTVEGWFKPLVDADTCSERHLKDAMSRYRLAQAEAEREARELAAQAAAEGDAETLLAALTVATEAGAKPAGARATTKFAWRVKGVPYPAAVPREYWCVDRAKLDALAKAHKGDDPPIVPGVEFERVAQIGAKR